MQRDYVPLFRSICTSDKMADLPDHECRLFYVLLLSQCDSWGRIADSPRALCAQVWAMFGGTPKATERALAELARLKLIERHTSDGLTWIQITNWESNAGSVGHPDRRGRSKFPGPTPESVRTTPVSVLSEQSRAEENRGEERRAEEPVAVAPVKPRAPRTGPQADLIRFWCDEWEKTRGSIYAAETKDFVAASAVLKLAGGSLDEATRRAGKLLHSADAWMTQNASLPLLRSKWNQLAFDVVGQRGVEPKGANGIRDYFAKNGEHHASA